ncbi:MAG: cytochrome c, partial [Flavobacteriales bacterium]|nr:cytochrome c [Flavobacteriales bacterium]
MRNLFKWVSKLRLALHLLLFLMITGVSVSQAQPNGEEIFKANCKSCHTIGKGPLIGPDLKDVETRA